MNITPAAARKEITRRANNKTGDYKAPAATAVAKAASRLGGAELRTLAGTTPSTPTVKTTQAQQVTLTDGRIAVIVAQAPATAKPAKAARKTGVGSRGGDPRKAEAFAVAQATGAKVWSPDFKLAYNTHLDSLLVVAGVRSAS